MVRKKSEISFNGFVCSTGVLSSDASRFMQRFDDNFNTGLIRERHCTTHSSRAGPSVRIQFLNIAITFKLLEIF